MDPCFTDWCSSTLMLLIRALNSVKFIFCSVYLVIIVEFVLGRDANRQCIQLLLLDTWTLSYKFTDEHPIKTEASLMTEANWFNPGIALFEENMLVVSTHKIVFHRVAILIDCFMHLFFPSLVKSLAFDEEHGLILHQCLDDLRINILELESHGLPLELRYLDHILGLTHLVGHTHPLEHLLWVLDHLYPVHVMLVNE